MSVNWILSRLTVEEGGEVESNFLYQSYKFHCLESGVTENVWSQNAFIDNVKCHFPNMKKGRKKNGTTSETVYRGVTLQEVESLREIQFSEIHKGTPPGINLKSTSDDKLIFEQDSTHLCNGNKVIKVLTFNVEGTFEISISGTKIDLNRLNIDPVFTLNKSSISTVFSIFNNIKLCTGLKTKKSLMVTKFHTLDNWESNGSSFRTLRSLSCLKVVLMNSKTSTCRVCQQQYFKKDKENIPTESETNTSCTAEISTENAIRNLFPNAPPAMISMLQEQAKNVDRHPNGRRWSKQFITNCLHLYNRSPKCYELLVESKMLVLPSKSMLILYKNSIKQEPGFDSNVFEWMHEEATRLGIYENERIGCLIFDEMSIKEDIVIEKNGNILELTGFTELGEEGNHCQSLRRGTKNKIMGTHILQLLFLGINGFRFPFAHFVTDNILASQLYALFWKSVYLLSGFGFEVLYTCMDGAQCNRAFMHTCLGENPTKYSTPSTCTSQPLIFMMC